MQTIEEDSRRSKDWLMPREDDALWDDSGATGTDEIMATGKSENEGVQLFMVKMGGTFADISSEQRLSALVQLLTQREIGKYREEREGADEEILDDPFEELDRKKPKERRIATIIEGFRLSTELRYGRRLADRLQFLIQEERAQYPVEWEFSQSSLVGFLTFMENNPRLRYPDVSLSPDGLIMAQWRDSSTRNAVLKFQDAGEVQFVLFAPSVTGTAQISGVTSPDKAFKTLQLHGADRWCTR